MKISFLNKQKEKLVGILEGKGKKGVILLHGFTGNKAGMNPIADALRDEFLTLRFDFSGNGESEGIFEEATYSKETDDALAAVDFMKNQGCTSLALVGHSMGAAVALLAGAKTKVDVVVSLAGPSKPNPQRMAKYAREWVNKDLPKSFLDDLAKTDILAAVKKIKNPLLIVHGGSDSVLPVAEAYELDKLANNPKKLVILPGIDHDFGEETPQVLREVREWLQKYL